jgi:DnaJ family protein C protein 28
MGRLESAVEKIIREAMEEGEFDNLQGKGQPVDLRENPFEDPDLRTAHRLLRNAGFAPAWLEERKDIDFRLSEASKTLGRAWDIYGRRNDQHPEWTRNLQEFRQLAGELNDRIRLYNLKAPAAVFHRRLIEPERIISEICGSE